MIYSMTGYGRAEKETDGRKITIELNSLNNRFSEIIVRLPKSLSHLESSLKEIVSSRIKRGKIMVSIVIEEAPELLAARMELNSDIALMYHKIFTSLKEQLKLNGDIELKNFVGLPDLIIPKENDIDEEHLREEIVSCLTKALDDFLAMRAAEGKKLMEDIVLHLNNVEEAVALAEKSADENIRLYNDKLRNRLKELLSGIAVSEEMIANEAAIVAEKSDITEECVRLRSHLIMFRDACQSDEPVGKKMNFILQELYREANTIGSKSISSEISRCSILMKEEIEKIREQVQNLE